MIGLYKIQCLIVGANLTVVSQPVKAFEAGKMSQTVADGYLVAMLQANVLGF